MQGSCAAFAVNRYNAVHNRRDFGFALTVVRPVLGKHFIVPGGKIDAEAVRSVKHKRSLSLVYYFRPSCNNVELFVNRIE